MTGGIENSPLPPHTHPRPDTHSCGIAEKNCSHYLSSLIPIYSFPPTPLSLSVSISFIFLRKTEHLVKIV